MGPIQWIGHLWVGRWGKFNGLQISGWFMVRSCMDVAICGRGYRDERRYRAVDMLRRIHSRHHRDHCTCLRPNGPALS